MRIRDSIEEEASGLVIAAKSQHKPANDRQDPGSAFPQMPLKDVSRLPVH
jgi:hypothetical protein